jgi:hypothetical protein
MAHDQGAQAVASGPKMRCTGPGTLMAAIAMPLASRMGAAMQPVPVSNSSRSVA